MAALPVRIGCSGWNYTDWRGRVYPPGCRRGAGSPTTRRDFDTVEVNAPSTGSPGPARWPRWVADTPPGFVFAVKASRYLTHMKRLADMGRGVERLYDGIAPLVASRSSVRCCGSCRRTSTATTTASAPRSSACRRAATASSSATRAGSPSPSTTCCAATAWHSSIGDDPRRPFQALELTADWTFIRFHRGRRGRRGNYSETELREWAARIRGLRARAEVFAYFNNDWEGFAPRNARRLRSLLER